MIEFITTSFFVFSSIYGSSTSVLASNQATITPVVAAATIEASTTTDTTNKEIEAQAKEYFKDTPILADIAFCESSFRQYDADGNVLRGKVDKDDVGVMQINEHYQGQAAKDLGYDLDTPEGNMAYAKYLYEKEGVQPWASSEDCWKGDLAAMSGNQVAMK